MKIRTISTPLNMMVIPLLVCSSIYAAPPATTLSQVPLFVTSTEKANVLVVLDNSNSMDEAANGSAAGSANANSKSEIARGAVQNLITNYTGKINMGLMAYQQSGVSQRHLHNSPYDVSFDPANYNSAFSGARDSLTKRFRTPNLSNPGNFIYYNIGLPFYDSSNQGSRYCYTVSADFDNGSEIFPAGPWDSYRCFRNKLSTSDTLPVWNDSLSESAQGFTSHAFNGTFSPTDSDLAQGILDFGSMITWNWVSEAWASNSSPGRGYLHTPILELDAVQATAINTKLATSQFVTNGITDPSLPLQNAGLTPLEGTLITAQKYFTDPSTLDTNEGGGSLPALLESCDKDFVALLTDGLPSVDASGAVISNTAAALADVATVAADLHADGVDTYTIGFALPVGTDPTTLDGIANAGGTGTAYLANNPASLQTTFDTIFTDILAKTGASSSAATNSTSLSTNSFVYQARFNSGDWAGELKAKSILTTGSISSSEAWNAATLLTSKSPNDRVIFTYGRDSNDGIPFRWSNISGQTDAIMTNALNLEPITLIPDALGANRVDFLRGGTGGASSSLFRTDRAGKLGDIIHSTPHYVGIPNAGYSDSEMPGYASFRTLHASRSAIIYTGANDGMLHAFNAVSGEEVFAYIPREIVPNLKLLTALGYGKTVPHKYFVDGAPMVADAYVGSSWKTVLAGGLNAGGQGVYALDITNLKDSTNPTTFSETTTNAVNTVLWEFTDEDDADLGYTFIDPTTNHLTKQSSQIAKMANGKWAVIFGNGYNNSEADGHASTTGHAYLYILFIEQGLDGVWTSGTDYIKIDTDKGSVSSPNGLATPNPIDTDGDGDIDFIYAGDLFGNLWKFDVSDTDTDDWEIKISGDKPLFTAKDASNNVQAITTAPLITRHPDGDYMIGFATGKYNEHSDLSDTSEQTIYGIWDENHNISDRSLLVEQTVLNQTTIGGNDFRVTSSNVVDYISKKGWFMDLPETGERVDINPVIRDGRFVFVTRTPSTVTCDAGGTSWLMELDYLTGGRLDISPFDVNGDGIINHLDYVEIQIGVDANGDPIMIKVPVSGFRDGNGGMISAPTILETDEDDEELKILANSKGQIKTILESVQTDYKGRVSWEEIR